MTDGRDLGIRPLGLGEVVDRSVALTRRHFRALFLAMLVIEAPAVALARVESARLGELVGTLGDPALAAAALRPTAGFLAVLLAAFLLLQLVATSAVAVLVAPSLDPRPRATLAPARLAVAVLTAALLQALALALAPALGVLPGLALAWRADSAAGLAAGTLSAVVLGLAAFVIAVVRLVLTPVAAAVEGRGPSAVLRSIRLMAPPRGVSLAARPTVRASLVLLATFLLVLAVNALAGLPRALAGRLASAPGPLGLPFGPLPLPLEIALSLVEALAAAALQPFSLVAVVVLYYERRARTEGLDVEIWAERLGAPP